MVKIDEKELKTLVIHAMLWMLNGGALIGDEEAEATIRKWEKWKQARER